MAIFDTNLDFTKLIQFTNGTLQLGSFVQIRNALIQRMKDIYGNDIDVSPASGDGQYINSISLLLNNIFQTIKQGYDSFDPAVATGQYLDTLCSFNNISRILSTNSVAQLYIYNSTKSPIHIDSTTNYTLTFIDKNNTLWIWETGGKDFIFPPEEVTLIDGVKCNELGAISAPGSSKFYHKVGGQWVAVDNPNQQDWDDDSLYTDFSINGTIYQTVGNLGLRVWQYSDAEEGESDETDEALRSRRYQMLGNASVTVLEGLKGSLLNVDGIKDAFIFNNITPTNGQDGTGIILTSPAFEPIADQTALFGHSIYVALRYKEGVIIPEEIIGRIIYNKLTPGILTNQPNPRYIQLTTQPADWDLNYKNYYTITMTTGTVGDPWAYGSYYVKDGDNYILLSKQPISFDPTSYYYDDGTKILPVTGGSAPTFVSGQYYSRDDYKYLEIVRTEDFSDKIYWKKCQPIKPTITLNFYLNKSLYDFPTLGTSIKTAAHIPESSIELNIVKNLQQYISTIKINEYLTVSGLMTVLQQSDINKNGMSTFFSSDGDIATKSVYPANLNYFKYDFDETDNTGDYEFSYDLANNKGTVTIG